MIISSSVINYILSQVANQKKESGGLLGFDVNKTIICTQLDSGLFENSKNYTYYPNIPLFKKKLLEWSKKNISFAGIFHTHYSDVAELSDADIFYIEKILVTLLVDEPLYFPILLMPSKIFIPFEAKIDENGKIRIREDRLIVLD